jgi:hypothetical protein
MTNLEQKPQFVQDPLERLHDQMQEPDPCSSHPHSISPANMTSSYRADLSQELRSRKPSSERRNKDLSIVH